MPAIGDITSIGIQVIPAIPARREAMQEANRGRLVELRPDPGRQLEQELEMQGRGIDYRSGTGSVRDHGGERRVPDRLRQEPELDRMARAPNGLPEAIH